ncbi:hypothetical protein [Magnetofaba australis]|uniref:hypothetical protein n=1 Tax=Magnetofaba australis TaxID=1472297 RepID=UPI000A19E249|nr:hypothetical protein [Magnetofaba australis]
MSMLGITTYLTQRGTQVMTGLKRDGRDDTNRGAAPVARDGKNEASAQGSRNAPRASGAYRVTLSKAALQQFQQAPTTI